MAMALSADLEAAVKPAFVEYVVNENAAGIQLMESPLYHGPELAVSVPWVRH
jgi:hypothetical protein